MTSSHNEPDIVELELIVHERVIAKLMRTLLAKRTRQTDIVVQPDIVVIDTPPDSPLVKASYSSANNSRKSFASPPWEVYVPPYTDFLEVDTLSCGV